MKHITEFRSLHSFIMPWTWALNRKSVIQQMTWAHLGKVSHQMTPFGVVLCEHIKKERFYVVVQSLVVQKELGEKTEVLTVYCADVTINLNKSKQIIYKNDSQFCATPHLVYSLLCICSGSAVKYCYFVVCWFTHEHAHNSFTLYSTFLLHFGRPCHFFLNQNQTLQIESLWMWTKYHESNHELGESLHAERLYFAMLLFICLHFFFV